jgi:hypothetical protein
VPAWRMIAEPRAPRASAVAAQQVGGHAALIEEDILSGVAQWQPLTPSAPVSGDVRPGLFVGVQCFF